jgi:hypothetical protein
MASQSTPQDNPNTLKRNREDTNDIDSRTSGPDTASFDDFSFTTQLDYAQQTVGTDTNSDTRLRKKGRFNDEGGLVSMRKASFQVGDIIEMLWPDIDTSTPLEIQNQKNLKSREEDALKLRFVIVTGVSPEYLRGVALYTYNDRITINEWEEGQANYVGVRDLAEYPLSAPFRQHGPHEPLHARMFAGHSLSDTTVANLVEQRVFDRPGTCKKSGQLTADQSQILRKLIKERKPKWKEGYEDLDSPAQPKARPPRSMDAETPVPASQGVAVATSLLPSPSMTLVLETPAQNKGKVVTSDSS